MDREKRIKELLDLVKFVEGVPEEDARPIIEQYTDKKIEEDIEFYGYIANK